MGVYMRILLAIFLFLSSLSAFSRLETGIKDVNITSGTVYVKRDGASLRLIGADAENLKEALVSNGAELNNETRKWTLGNVSCWEIDNNYTCGFGVTNP